MIGGGLGNFVRDGAKDSGDGMGLGMGEDREGGME